MHKSNHLFGIINTLIEYSSNTMFTSMLFISEQNTSIMGSMKSIIGKRLENFHKYFNQNVLVSVYQNDSTQVLMS